MLWTILVILVILWLLGFALKANSQLPIWVLDPPAHAGGTDFICSGWIGIHHL